MAKSATVRARIDPQLKAEAEMVLSELGLTPTSAITLYYQQIAKSRGIPFELSLPDAATIRALDDAGDDQVRRIRQSEERLSALDPTRQESLRAVARDDHRRRIT